MVHWIDVIQKSNYQQLYCLEYYIFFKKLYFQYNPVFTHDKRPEWAYRDFWAPEIHFVNGTYLAYFSARQKSDNRLAIGVAISQNPTNPFGPYEDFGQPIIEGEPGVIDIHWFRDPVYVAQY